MSSLRSNQVKQIFQAALQTPPVERTAFLEQACAGDAALRVEVASLLAAHDQAGTFIDAPPSAPGAMRAIGNLGPFASKPWTAMSTMKARTSGDEVGPRRLTSGEIIGHYELVEWIGAGGMGQVFRARDLALGRTAALKLLPRQFTPDLRLRLRREAEACARLQHPAIATFYEAGEDSGETFIAMEYVQGETLRSRLKNGALSLEDALPIARCMLEALEHAHAAGILHRDVKPENVMTSTAGPAKLLDFGLARHLVAPAAASAFTQSAPIAVDTSSCLAGTIGYMAPEQLRGDPLDARTDVFQVGAVLYEMLVGRPALIADCGPRGAGRVLREQPDFSLLAHGNFPADLTAVLARALARDPADRYPSAAAFLRSLEDLVDGGVATSLPKLVAVMDFDNKTGDDDLGWIGVDTAARIAVELSSLSGVTVVPREKILCAIQLLERSERAAAPVDLGLHLGCASVVVGSVEGARSTLCLAMQLIEVATARIVKTAHVDMTVDQHLFAAQEVLAAAAVHAMGCAPLARGRRHPASMEAHQSFARARPLLDQLSKGSVEQALELLEHAVTIDPGYAPALAGLAWAYGFRSIATTDPADVDSALHYAERAISIDPLSSEAHMWRGYALLRRNEHDEAAHACHRASELAPANASAPYFAGSALMFGGRAAEALPWLQRALDLDAKVGMGWLALGAAHLSLQQLLEAHYSFTRARDVEGVPVRFPTAGAAAYIAEVLRLQGQLEDARRLAVEGLESAERSDHAYRDFFRAHALVVLGRTALDQHDLSGARAAFHQVLAQARGRPRTRSCGQLVVQALTGLARGENRVDVVAEAHRVFDARETYNFEPFFGALDEQTLFELTAASHMLGRIDEAQALARRARAAGSRRTPDFDVTN